MLKKTIIFKDLDGNPVTEDFYFNMTKAELTEMELSQKDGLSDYLKKIVESKDAGMLIMLFKDIIVKSVGQRSEDNRRFIKNQEVIDSFIQTDAYSELFMELATKTDAGVEFITGIVPSDLKEELEKANAIPTAELEDGTVAVNDPPAAAKSARQIYSEKLEDPTWTPTPRDLQLMDKDQISMAFMRKASSVPEI